MPRDPASIVSEQRTSKESVTVTYMRQDASTAAHAAIRRVLAPFTGDALDRKLVLDAIERGIERIRTEEGL